ncbi:DNA phosphorothioation-dependent restriction protein DptH [Rheinheimera mesophila]|uniref:DNA phosphorothioation-dependent restriction protein DptH n=1 Tax=Rheinheimera mesophila TaxID=1547515 RepID=A0A3P3QJI5_9GAMM|nr:DNA phosphorothioation-dependent restriction protein DptH [Rheinheimera mesophila]KKL02481.1 cell division protein FtsK [Rheinheimera mesophila]RRJ21334.1 DNA phosphorothioation-dependent restriction protein DptH [Rheinheimera mesophila]
MSEKQFEDFLVDQLVHWGNEELKAGFRYQFKSPDNTNSEKLVQALWHRHDGNLEDNGTSLSYLMINGIRLITVLHGANDSGFTENYISRLRDLVASQSGEFHSSALLVIHNSMLDTIINSADDLAQQDKVWHPLALKEKLKSLINQLDPRRHVSHNLLNLVFKQIIENGGTVFGFGDLYKAILDGDLKFDELGLLNDSELIRYDEDGQIQSRLDENRRLHERIAEITERFPNELTEKLAELDFGESFVDKYFSEPEKWRQELELEACLQEQKKNRAAGLQLEAESTDVTSILIPRDKASTKAGKRERHLLLVLNEGATEVDFELTFVGDTVERKEVEIREQSENKVEIAGISNAGGKRSRIKIRCEQLDKPLFFALKLKRDKTSESYNFKVVVLPFSDFQTDEIAHNFLVQPKAKKLLIQTDDNKLKISDLENSSRLEQLGQVFETKTTGAIDFELMASESAELSFTVKTSAFNLDFEVEGAVASDSLTLPLLLDSDRYLRLFDADYFGVFNRSKNKIILDNQEVAPKGRRLTLLQWEHQLVTEQLLYRHDEATRNISALDLTSYPALQSAYLALFSELQTRRSLPSLSGWDSGYRALVKHVVEQFFAAVSDIQHNEVLSKEQKQLMHLGFSVFDGNDLLTPLHPLVLAYYLFVAEQISLDKEKTQSFAELPRITKERLNAQGLLPYVFNPQHDFSYVQVERDNSFWMQLVAQKDTSFSYVRKLVFEKVSEFQNAFSMLFSSGPKAKLLINSVNNHDNSDLFMGLVDLVKTLKDKVPYIHVSVYDDKLEYNEFDRFADIGKHEELKQRYELDKGKAREYADLVVDLLRTRLTYSKFENTAVASQNYAHISFFRNNQRVERTDIDPEQELSGVVCNGLIAGEAADNKQDSYFTAFGLKGVETDQLVHLQLARDYNRLLKPAFKTNEQHGNAKSTALAVNDAFRTLLERSYDSSIWTCIIDPKVTLDFFESSKDVVLIHYSDNYTNSTNYDAITVTKQTDLYRKVLERDEQGGHIEEFNAFNGEWLLKMITDRDTERKAKRGIIGAYKYVNSLLAKSDITWVPLSIAEIVRVAGNIGLKISESDFARKVQGYKQGAISDDVLFAGFKDDKLYLLPLEVKTGKRQTHTKGYIQAKELKRYFAEDLLGRDDLAGWLYRGLFARQVLMQVEKYRLYSLYEQDYFEPITSKREWWLKGQYSIGELADYPEGFLLVNVEDNFFSAPCFTEEQGILKIELPSGLLSDLIKRPLKTMLATASVETLFHIPEQYLLGPHHAEAVSEQPVYQANMGTELRQAAETYTGEQPKPEILPQVIIAEKEPLKVLFGHDARNDKPLYWEPTNTARFMNTNTGIIGTMGTGKTQFTKAMITQLHRNQHHNVNSAPIGMLIFDYKSDYVDDAFINATNAKKYKLFKLPYNPLSLFGDTPMLPIHTAAGFSETMAKAYGLGPKQQLKLENLILEAYTSAGITPEDASSWHKPAPTIEDIWALFIAQEKVEEDSLYAALSKLARFKIFESIPENMTSLYELTSGITVIELAGYPSEIQNLVVALTLDLFYSQMQKRGKPKVQADYRQITKMILVDEADNFMSQNFNSLRRILKEGREYGVGVVLSTQDITHFKTGENNYASYILTWVIHRVAEIRNADIKAIFNVDDKGEQENLMEAVRRLEKHFSLYIDGKKTLTKMRDKAFWELVG